MNIKLIITAAICIMYGCAEQKSEKNNSFVREINKAKWLEGQWENRKDSVYVYESWNAANDSTLTGNGYVIIGSDTVSSEIMSLEERGGIVNYIPTVQNQNDGKPVAFKMVSGDSVSLVFENPAHDFPQKITYRKVNNDSLVAVISGNFNGKAESQEFALKRKQ